MNQEMVAIKEKSSKKIDPFNLIVGVRGAFGSYCHFVVGSPGMQNVVKENAYVGDAILFETPNHGILEVRTLSISTQDVEFLVSQVSPRLGITGGFINEDPNNLPFTPIEISQVSASIAKIKNDMSRREDITSEQLKLLERKLDEILEASGRLGRKDWINYVAGSLTTLSVSAAFAPEVSKAILQSVNSAFSWLFDNALVLLS